MSRVIVFGSINMDCVASVRGLPQAGETVLGNDLKYFPGGKGANQAVAAAQLGANTIIIGKVGDDGFADFMREFLVTKNVDVSKVVQTKGATGTALIAVDEAGENTIIVIPAANGKITAQQVEAFDFQEGDILVCQNEIPLDAMHVAFEKAKANKATVIYNPAPAVEVPEALFKLADYVVVNESEHNFYEHQLSAEMHTIIQTLGSQGVKTFSAQGEKSVKGHKVDVVDTTGAGDCFTGALATRLCFGDRLDQAVTYANKAASIAVTRHGAGTSMPTVDDVK